jgi:tetratricopeptide (TPR) repeat protein
VALAPPNALGHVALGLAFIHRQQLPHAIAEVETALSLNPSSAYAHFTYGQMLTRIDRCEEALEQCDAALRLSPRDPNTWRYLSLRASALYLLRRYEEAAKSAREASRHPTADAIWPYIYLAAASAYLGETAEAAAALAALREKRPNLTISWLLSWPNFRIRSQATLDHMIEGMRKAGVPE